MSLLDVQDCEIPDGKVEHAIKAIRLYQMKKFDTVEVRQCKVFITRKINHCEESSHDTSVLEPDRLQDLRWEECETMHLHGSYKLQPDMIITDIKPNGTRYSSVIVAGSRTSYASCDGATYSTGQTTYSKVVVEEKLHITLSSYTTLAIEARTYFAQHPGCHAT